MRIARMLRVERSWPIVRQMANLPKITDSVAARNVSERIIPYVGSKLFK